MTNREYVVDFVTSRFETTKVELVDPYQVAFVVEQASVHPLLAALKLDGWRQLSYLSAVDWLADGEFELVYILMNWEKPVYVQVRTRIPREEASMPSILSIFPGSKYYERECHEFFGIKFPGNPDYHKQLILEEWDDLPPLRKDFDPKAYSDAHFPSRQNQDTYTVLNGEDSKQAKREARSARSERIGKGVRQ